MVVPFLQNDDLARHSVWLIRQYRSQLLEALLQVITPFLLCSLVTRPPDFKALCHAFWVGDVQLIIRPVDDVLII